MSSNTAATLGSNSQCCPLGTCPRLLLPMADLPSPQLGAMQPLRSVERCIRTTRVPSAATYIRDRRAGQSLFCRVSTEDVPRGRRKRKKVPKTMAEHESFSDIKTAATHPWAVTL